MLPVIRQILFGKKHYIPIRHSAGTFDFSITNGLNVLWVFSDGSVSTAAHPNVAVSAGTTKLYADNLNAANIQLNDNASNAMVLLDLADLQGKLIYLLDLAGCTNVTGSLADLQGKLTYYLNLAHCAGVTGSLADLQGKLTYHLDLYNCTHITGDLGDLDGNLTNYLDLTNCAGVTGVYTPVGTGTPTVTILTGTGLSAADMDNTLIAYAAGSKDNGKFTATGKNRTAASDAAITTLEGRGWTISGLTKV